MRARADGGFAAGDRHRVLREALRELDRHPVVVDVRGHPPSTFTELRATLAPERWGHDPPGAADHAGDTPSGSADDAGDATLRVTWHPLDPPEFAFHYSEPGFDCGWHHEPNPHVDGLGHYQERTGDEAYTYEPVEFEGDTAAELVWEVLERLRGRLERQ